MRFALVDVFTDGPFTGATSPVVIVDRPVDEEWMMSVAAELLHPETAFVFPETGGLRWFSADQEMDLVGSATMAAARLLGDSRTFRTLSGDLRCEVQGVNVSMDFPADPPIAVDLDLTRALPGVEVREVWRGVRHLMAVVDDRATVENLVPNLAEISRLDAFGLAVTAPGGAVDFVSRWFGPKIGIPEAINGSTHCMLAPYWARRLQKTQLVAQQVSQRPGRFTVRMGERMVTLGGQAKVIVEGDLKV